MTFMTFHILGMSSSQLTFIFFRGLKPPTRSNMNLNGNIMGFEVGYNGNLNGDTGWWFGT